MIDTLVVDASAAVAFIAKEQRGNQVEGALRAWRAAGRPVIVPPLFWLEILNALTGRRRWRGAEVLEAVADLDRVGIQTADQDRALVLLTLDTVERYRLSAYDACYLALALQQDAWLLTLDPRLAAAAGGRAVPLGDHERLAELASTFERDVTWPDYRGASAYLAKLRAETFKERRAQS